MKKSLLLGLSTLALIGTATVSHARMNDNSWYVGAGASWIGTNMENKVSLENGNGDTGPSKVGLEDKSAFGGTFLVGYNFEVGSTKAFTELGYGFDSSSANGTKTLTDPGDATSDIDTTLNRFNTYSLGIGTNFNIDQSLDAFVKVSILHSKFEVVSKSSNVAGGVNGGTGIKKVSRWGWAPTIGLEKNLGSGFNLKADYSYQMYSRIRSGIETSTTTDADTLNKINPRYHVVGLTLTKTL